MFEQTFADGITTVYADDAGNRFVITANETNIKARLFSVFVKEAGKKGRTVATRTTYENAVSIGINYFS